MKTLAEIQAGKHAYVKGVGGWFEVGEGNWRLNKFSRAKVRAFKRERGEAWLGNVNLHHNTKPNFQKYERGMVYNFQAHFVIPCDDTELKALIQERMDAEYTGTKADGDMVDVIFERIDAIGGIFLNWV